MSKLGQSIKKLKENLAAVYLAYKRRDTPFIAKAVALLAVGYALSPIDLIPDFIPILGQIDDLIILPILIWLALRLIPKPIMESCRAQAVDMWSGGRPKMWRFAIPIIIFWIIILGIILYAIFAR